MSSQGPTLGISNKIHTKFKSKKLASHRAARWTARKWNAYLDDAETITFKQCLEMIINNHNAKSKTVASRRYRDWNAILRDLKDKLQSHGHHNNDLSIADIKAEVKYIQKKEKAKCAQGEESAPRDLVDFQETTAAQPQAAAQLQGFSMIGIALCLSLLSGKLSIADLGLHMNELENHAFDADPKLNAAMDAIEASGVEISNYLKSFSDVAHSMHVKLLDLSDNWDGYASIQELHVKLTCMSSQVEHQMRLFDPLRKNKEIADKNHKESDVMSILVNELILPGYIEYVLVTDLQDSISTWMKKNEGLKEYLGGDVLIDLLNWAHEYTLNVDHGLDLVHFLLDWKKLQTVPIELVDNLSAALESANAIPDTESGWTGTLKAKARMMLTVLR